MTEYQRQSKNAHLLDDLEDVKKKLEKFYSYLTSNVDDKLLIESLDAENFLYDVREIRDIAKRIEASVKDSVQNNNQG